MSKILLLILLLTYLSSSQIGVFEAAFETSDAKQITNFGADIGGDISLQLNDPIATKWGVVWNDSGNPTFADNSVTFTGSTRDSTFFHRVENIPKDDIIYYKAFMENSDGLFIGTEKSFASIPTLGEIGMIIFTISMMMLGIYYLRRVS